MIYAYLRVSSRDQFEDRQLIAVNEFIKREYAGEKVTIYTDKQSGKDFDRDSYKKLYRRLKPGDVLIIKSIDRLGRNYDEILDEWRKITKNKGCDIVILDMPLLDTRNNRDLTGTLIADIVLELLSYVAQQEREFIRQRQAEGIEAAKLRGVRFGRPKKIRPDNYKEVEQLWDSGEISARKAANLLGVNRGTFKKWISEDK